MKSFYLVLFFLLNFASIHAQDWMCIKPDRKNYYGRGYGVAPPSETPGYYIHVMRITTQAPIANAETQEKLSFRLIKN